MFEQKSNKILFHKYLSKMQNKRNRTVGKYHFDIIKICRETDVVYTRCRVCKEYKPSDLKHFMKESHYPKNREIQPLCRECNNKIQRETTRLKKEQEQRNTNFEVHTLFEEDEESIESKIDRIMKYLGLKK